MKTIPTVKELVNKIDEDFYKKNSYYLSKTEPETFAIQVALEFAKLHVEACIEEIKKKAKTKDEVHTYHDSWASPGGGSEIIQVINKQSIEDAYPLNLIK